MSDQETSPAAPDKSEHLPKEEIGQVESKKELGTKKESEIKKDDSPPKAGSHADVPKPPVEGFVSMRLSKKVIWSLVVTFLVVILGVGLWYSGSYERVKDLYNTTSITVRVKEDDKFALAGAKLVIDGQEYTSDENGKISIQRIVAGEYGVSITKEGYEPYEAKLSVVRGDNDIASFSLKKVVEQLYAIKAVVTDYVSEEALADVQVAVKQQGTGRTSPSGEVSFDKLPAGEYTATFTKSGYVTAEKTVTLSSTAQPLAVTLVPSGQVVFVSNRDGGKRSLYVTSYDGSNQHQLVTPQNGGEDFSPIFSPDNKFIVFSSTRDAIRTTYDVAAPRLYLVDRDGKGLKKISDEIMHSSVKWSPNGEYLYYSAYADTALTQFKRQFYNVQSGASFELGEAADDVVFLNKTNSAVYATTQEGITLLRLVNLANGERRQLVSKTASYFQNISVAQDDATLTYQAYENGSLRRFKLNLSSLQEEELAVGEQERRTYYPSPDGKSRVFVEERDGKRDLYLIGADNKEVRLTTSGVIGALAPRWDASGRYVVVGLQRVGETALSIVSTSGKGSPKKIVDYFAYSSDGYTY